MTRSINGRVVCAVLSGALWATMASCLDDNTNYLLHREEYETQLKIFLDIQDDEVDFPQNITHTPVSKREGSDSSVTNISDYCCHYVVTVTNEKGVVVNNTVSDEPDIEIPLIPGIYSVYAWADYVPGEQRSPRDYWYFTDEPAEMLLKEKYKYIGNEYSKRAYAGSRRIRIAAGDTRSTEERITLTAPMGRYRFVADGTPDFVPARVHIMYSGGMWGGHNIISDEPVVRWSGVGFTIPFVSADELVFDHLIAPSCGETFLMTLEIYDTDGILRARAKDVKVPVMRGMLTTVSGDFFNILELDEKPEAPAGDGGIGIDPSFDNEYTITINR